MTLAEFLKEYSLLVTTITGLITLILGYYLGKWDAERKRKWELEDRKIDRRAKVYDSRIKEAKDYVDTLQDLLYIMDDLCGVLLADSDLTVIGEELSESTVTAERMTDLYEKASKQIVIIPILADDELESWHSKLYSSFFVDIEYLTGTIVDVLELKCTTIDKEKLENLSQSARDGIMIIACMNQRLDELAQET